MEHDIKVNGYSYRLVPVKLSDAQFIIDTRLEDEQKNQFVHKISNDIKAQENWLLDYFKRDNDYYFVVENLFTQEKEGLISIYNINNNKAEWGRWVLKRGSLAALESVALIYQAAFEILNLDEVYTRTIENNTQVVNFHKRINAKFRGVLENEFELEGQLYNAVEQYVDKEYYFSVIKEQLKQKTLSLFERNMRNNTSSFEFHHIGIATKNLESEYQNYQNEYQKGDYFEDNLQGVKGLFLNSDIKPTLELLENLPESYTLDYYLKKGIKEYHRGYFVKDIGQTKDFFTDKLNAKIVSDLKQSVYFKKRICFLLLKNKTIVELIERNV